MKVSRQKRMMQHQQLQAADPHGSGGGDPCVCDRACRAQLLICWSKVCCGATTPTLHRRTGEAINEAKNQASLFARTGGSIITQHGYATPAPATGGGVPLTPKSGCTSRGRGTSTADNAHTRTNSPRPSTLTH